MTNRQALKVLLACCVVFLFSALATLFYSITSADHAPAEVLTARKDNAKALITGMRSGYKEGKLEVRDGMVYMSLGTPDVDYILVSVEGEPHHIQTSPNKMDIYVDSNGDGTYDNCDCAVGRDDPDEIQRTHEEQIAMGLKKLGLIPKPIPPTPKPTA